VGKNPPNPPHTNPSDLGFFFFFANTGWISSNPCGSGQISCFFFFFFAGTRPTPLQYKRKKKNPRSFYFLSTASSLPLFSLSLSLPTPSCQSRLSLSLLCLHLSQNSRKSHPSSQFFTCLGERELSRSNCSYLKLTLAGALNVFFFFGKMHF
jgi:hypothetical protein